MPEKNNNDACSRGSAAQNPDRVLPGLLIRTGRGRGVRIRDTAQAQDHHCARADRRRRA